MYTISDINNMNCYDINNIFYDAYKTKANNLNQPFNTQHDPYQTSNSDQILKQIQPRPHPPPPSFNTLSKARAPNDTSKKIQIF